jgi:hypothetical protein
MDLSGTLSGGLSRTRPSLHFTPSLYRGRPPARLGLFFCCRFFAPDRDRKQRIREMSIGIAIAVQPALNPSIGAIGFILAVVAGVRVLGRWDQTIL